MVSKGVPDNITVPPPVILNRNPEVPQQGKLAVLPTHCATPCPPSDSVREDQNLKELGSQIFHLFANLFDSVFLEHSDLNPANLVDNDHIRLICKNIEQLTGGLSLNSVFGAEPLEGTYYLILRCIDHWKLTLAFNRFQEGIRSAERAGEVATHKLLAHNLAKEAKITAISQIKAVEALECENRALV